MGIWTYLYGYCIYLRAQAHIIIRKQRMYQKYSVAEEKSTRCTLKRLKTTERRKKKPMKSGKNEATDVAHFQFIFLFLIFIFKQLLFLCFVLCYRSFYYHFSAFCLVQFVRSYILFFICRENIHIHMKASFSVSIAWIYKYSMYMKNKKTKSRARVYIICK